MSARSCDQLCPITAFLISRGELVIGILRRGHQCQLSVSISATCQCPSVPHQCHISVPTSAHQCHISVSI
ncbi:unnamed protein product [Staurois parvus]|uniref:Uncharacterized protein n=1 Tax=Staurois parvus TaxID=386267 RepID=A0ABN9FEH7_9NEOB|nr:unnamed protein product [Staurois parvus]